MKKIFTLILGITLAYSCSTSSDGNGNSTTTVVPIAPSNLTGTVAYTTQINLSWTDNSTNETGFKIERKTGSGTYAVVGTTATDVTTFSNTGLTPSTTYTFRVYSNNAVGNSLTYSNELTLTTANVINLPTLTTTAVSSISTNTAVSGGTISSDGGAAITVRGICWSTIANPTIALNTKTTDGIGTGVFTSNISGLTANTTYYVRSYATNSQGTAYGNELNFTTIGTLITDIDGNTYELVTICGQTWTKSNLNVSKYRNGDIIPQVTDANEWNNLTTGAWCYTIDNTTFQPSQSSSLIYGKLYNWYALNDPRGLAPSGYHIPTTAEWTTLIDCLGGSAVAGGKIKESGTIHWNSPNTGATNSSGFTALPSGTKNGIGQLPGCCAEFWSSSLINSNLANTIYMQSDYNYTLSVPQYSIPITTNVKSGKSVRCIKD